MSRRKSRFRSKSEAASAPRAERTQREPAAPISQAELSFQYKYVIGDLQRMGIVSVLLIVTMVVLRIFVIK